MGFLSCHTGGASMRPKMTTPGFVPSRSLLLSLLFASCGGRNRSAAPLSSVCESAGESNLRGYVSRRQSYGAPHVRAPPRSAHHPDDRVPCRERAILAHCAVGLLNHDAAPHPAWAAAPSDTIRDHQAFRVGGGGNRFMANFVASARKTNTMRYHRLDDGEEEVSVRSIHRGSQKRCR
jgi:hypothetical protein